MMQRIHGLDTRRLVGATGWLLAAVCVLLAARIVAVAVDGVDVDYAALPPVTRIAPEPVRTDADWRLFGEPVAPDYGLRSELPPTPLSLRLRGVVTGERGYAIIVDADGNEGVYRVGDEVPGEAAVLDIQPRRVVLTRDGTREALALPGAAERTATAPRRAAAPSERQGTSVAGLGIGSLASMTSRFALDPEQLAQRITIVPVAGGGFRVRAGRDAAMFTALGFHANDVVLAINGQPVGNRADVRAVFDDYRPGEPLAITVRRGERQLVLTPDLLDPGRAD
jgi:general secretion pathway protein C